MTAQSTPYPAWLQPWRKMMRHILNPVAVQNFGMAAFDMRRRSSSVMRCTTTSSVVRAPIFSSVTSWWNDLTFSCSAMAAVDGSQQSEMSIQDKGTYFTTRKKIIEYEPSLAFDVCTPLHRKRGGEHDSVQIDAAKACQPMFTSRICNSMG
jgi:hypothetical protein